MSTLLRLLFSLETMFVKDPCTVLSPVGVDGQLLTIFVGVDGAIIATSFGLTLKPVELEKAADDPVTLTNPIS